jgi:hypothetical protein
LLHFWEFAHGFDSNRAIFSRPLMRLNSSMLGHSLQDALCKTKTGIEKLSRSFFNRLGSHLSPISDINCIDLPVKESAVGTFFAKSP